MRAYTETECENSYEVRQYSDLSAPDASLSQVDLDWQNHRSVWDRVLGIGTMALISICGWAVIVELARLLLR